MIDSCGVSGASGGGGGIKGHGPTHPPVQNQNSHTHHVNSTPHDVPHANPSHPKTQNTKRGDIAALKKRGQTPPSPKASLRAAARDWRTWVLALQVIMRLWYGVV